MNAMTVMGGPAITSAEIAELVGKRHDNVKRAIETLIEQGVIVQPQIEDEPGTDAVGRSRTTQVFRFAGDRGKRDSIVVVAQLSPEFTARLVDRWQQLETQVALAAFAIPQSMPEALRLAAEALEGKAEAEAKALALEHQVQQDAPKVAFAKQVEVAPDALTIAQAAKVLDTGRNRLLSFLREIGWVTRRNEPYQEKIEAGLLDVKLGSWSHPEHGLQDSVTALVTGKGLSKLQRLWSERKRQINGTAPLAAGMNS